MIHILRSISMLLLTFFLSSMLYGQFEEPEENEIILMGKVTHAEFGNPIENFQVYIVSDSSEAGNMNYFNMVRTDDQGFYFDTIYTFFDAGSLVVYTYDFNDVKQESDVHFRFMSPSNDNIFINNFSVDIPFNKPILQARFTYNQDENSSKYDYKFFDKTENAEIISWHWDFGDGNTSGEQNPVYQYQYPGVFKVELTVEAIVFNHIEVNTISQYLFIPVNAYYHMGGHCFADDFPIDYALVYLYYQDDYQPLIPLDTTSIDTLGYYYFYQLQEGKYLVKVQPNLISQYYGDMIPTYYGDEMYWEDAHYILHDHTDWEYDIHMIQGAGKKSGDGLIAGKVVMSDKMHRPFGETLEFVDIYLLDENNNPIASHYTDSEGHFDFDELAMDTYWMCQEITGVPSSRVMIELNEEQPEIADITIDLVTGDITLDVFENQYFREISNPYPNPARDYLTMDVDMKKSVISSVYLLDLQGRIMKKIDLKLNNGVNRIGLSVNEFQNGYYILRLQTSEIVVDAPLVISR